MSECCMGCFGVDSANYLQSIRYVLLDNCISCEALLSLALISIHERCSDELLLTYFTPFLLVDFYMLYLSYLLNAVHTFNYLNVKNTTLSNGYLGSRNDEERSEMRYVMRIAEFSESSNL